MVEKEIEVFLGSMDQTGETIMELNAEMDKTRKKVEEKLAKSKEPLKVAVMGCVVNGPGEAAEADVGITGGRGVGIVFREGKIVCKVKEEELFNALFEEIDRIVAEKTRFNRI